MPSRSFRARNFCFGIFRIEFLSAYSDWSSSDIEIGFQPQVRELWQDERFPNLCQESLSFMKFQVANFTLDGRCFKGCQDVQRMGDGGSKMVSKNEANNFSIQYTFDSTIQTTNLNTCFFIVHNLSMRATSDAID
jgi:hypothetical protein